MERARSHRPPPPVGVPPRVSAAVVLDQLRVAAELLGDDVVARAMASLPEEARQEVRDLLPVSWCALSLAAAIHAAIARESGQEVNAWHRTIVRAGVERTLTTVWRIFTRLLSVESLVKRAAAIYEKSYDRGTVRASLSAPGVVEVVLEAWPDVPDFELDAIVAGLDAVLAIAGRQGVSITVARTPAGARFEVRYAVASAPSPR